ncbi:LOW QUALITY PROTEIN: blue-light photoreceptor PHR2 [Dioscorea cayenensis subsp. rotundata]|uniref:LOW QUALITY PROTEIN: blue-light photoreceptor PHR2 n=1 Tax=Dioscorea cayennensis subsp. rotundata TaxID=55577 RepID=A0AB40BP43_DIOCR|nr:LOW QUALITY PROTEIN: blue-light photoreceptor PHR2 [Dioscorea cayenensis subsp. rotundata]
MASSSSSSMDLQTLEQEEQQQQQPQTLQSPPIASLSLSLSPLLLLPSSKPSLSPFSSLKLPSQLSSVSLHLSSFSLSSKPFSSSSSSSSSISTLRSPLPLLPRRSSDPSHPVAGRRCSIVWFRCDLRIHDNDALTSASNDSLSILPIYLFDPRDFGKSSSGFDRTGPYRAAFLRDSVADLRRSLQSRGSDLVVRVGRPETILPELARAVGADAVYAHREVSNDEVRTEEKVEKVMQDEGVEMKLFWGSTLYHIDDLPFELDQMPLNYGGFTERVRGLSVRKTIEALDQIKGLPSRGDVDPGEIPSLTELGLNPPPVIAQDGKPVNATLVGGESEALQKLKTFAAECHAQPKKGHTDSAQDSIYGANFSCKISPWLAMGCLSPRSMFDELKKSATRTMSMASKPKNGTGTDDTGMNWLLFELLWRDFFRFITRKYSSKKRKLEPSAPATACTGALA